MDITSISSLTSAQTKLMLANVKAKATETSQNNSSTSTSTSTAAAAKPSAEASGTASTAAASTSTSTTDTSTTESDATKTAELIAELESGKDLTASEVQYLNKVSPGTYARILKQRTETSDYTTSLNNTTSTADATAVHLNKLTDLLTETKSVANDSSLTDDQKIAMYQSITSRVNSIENITSQFSTGSTDSAASITAFQNLLSASSNAMQQSVMLKYNPSLATSSDTTTATDTTSSTTAASSSSSSKSSSTASKTSKSTSTTDSTQSSTASKETSSTSSGSSTKSVSDTLAQIRTIISTETANAALSGVKTAGLNLLV